MNDNHGFYLFCMEPLLFMSVGNHNMDRVKRIWYLSPMRAAKVQASLRIRAVSPEPSLLAHTSSESRGTFRQKARSLAPLNGWACAVKICNDGMLEDTNSLDGAHMLWNNPIKLVSSQRKSPADINVNSMGYLVAIWCGSTFPNAPHSYIWALKIGTHSYTYRSKVQPIQTLVWCTE